MLLKINSYLYIVEFISHELVCIPVCNDDYWYADRFLDAIMKKGTAVVQTLMGCDNDVEELSEFEDKNLYRQGLAFIKTDGELLNDDNTVNSKVYGIWPSCLRDGKVTFTYDKINPI